MTPGISTIIKEGLTTRYSVLESFRLQAEGARRSRGQRPFEKFVFSRRVLLRYLMVKLKMFLGIFLWTFDHRLRVLLLARRRMEERIKPCDFSS